MSNFIDSALEKTGRILRGNRFKADIFFPVALVAQGVQDRFSTFIQATEIPSSEIPAVEVPVGFGAVVKVPGDKTPPADFNCTMILGEESVAIYRVMKRWQESMASNLTGLRGQGLAFYGGMTVQLYGNINNVEQQWEMIKIFPTSVGPLSLDKSSRDDYLTFDVSFVVNEVITNLI